MSKATAAQLGSPLLTETEAAVYLRLAEIGVNNVAATMAYYRQRKGLKAVRYGKKCVYHREDLNVFARANSLTGPEAGEK